MLNRKGVEFCIPWMDRFDVMWGCVCVCSGLSSMLAPTLLDADDGKGDNSANNEQPNDGHDPVKVTPPSGALISRLVDDLLLLPEGGMSSLEVCLKLVVRGFGGDGKKGSNHPS